jgi:hypothetical protein
LNFAVLFAVPVVNFELPSAPPESSHKPEQAFCCCTNGQAGEDVARPMSEENDPR